MSLKDKISKATNTSTMVEKLVNTLMTISDVMSKNIVLSSHQGSVIMFTDYLCRVVAGMQLGQDVTLHLDALCNEFLTRKPQFSMMFNKNNKTKSFYKYKRYLMMLHNVSKTYKENIIK